VHACCSVGKKSRGEEKVNEEKRRVYRKGTRGKLRERRERKITHPTASTLEFRVGTRDVWVEGRVGVGGVAVGAGFGVFVAGDVDGVFVLGGLFGVG